MGEKRCVTCKAIKPLDAFNRRATSPDGKQSRCRDCCKAWYLVNRTTHVRNAGIRKRRFRAEQRELLVAYLVEHPCVDCGEDDIRCLDFDHEDPTTKSFMISRAFATFPWKRILEEIAKCSVRCANCHRIRTAEQLRWWSTQIAPQKLRQGGTLNRRRRWSEVPGVYSVTSDGLQRVWRRAAS